MQIYEVSQITEIIKAGFDNSKLFRNVLIRGEIFNIKFHSSGHVYFSLKDSFSTIKCVMFQSYASKLRFKPDNGNVVLVEGYISVYARDGCYQLYCSAMKPDGEGDLQLKLEQLKRKLYQEGLFDDSHKKSIPDFPERIAVVTSPTGAAVRDIIRIIKSRWRISDILVVPVTVQGENAENEISEGIRLVNRYKLADLIITGRGGGSAEDMWAFNCENVVRAIYDSEIPVISAVGHEPDTCLSDFVADVRASTPSNAAERAVPDCSGISAELFALKRRMISAAGNKLNSSVLLLKPLSESRVLSSPERAIDVKRMDVQRVFDRLSVNMDRIVSLKTGELRIECGKLDVLSPLKQFDRGYSIAEKDGKILNSIEGLNCGDRISIVMRDGIADCSVDKTEAGEKYESADF